MMWSLWNMCKPLHVKQFNFDVWLPWQSIEGISEGKIPYGVLSHLVADYKVSISRLGKHMVQISKGVIIRKIQ